MQSSYSKIYVSVSYCKMGIVHDIQFLRYFAVSSEKRKLKSAKYFPSLAICFLPLYRTMIMYSMNSNVIIELAGVSLLNWVNKQGYDYYN